MYIIWHFDAERVTVPLEADVSYDGVIAWYRIYPYAEFSLKGLSNNLPQFINSSDGVAAVRCGDRVLYNHLRSLLPNRRPGRPEIRSPVVKPLFV